MLLVFGKKQKKKVLIFYIWQKIIYNSYYCFICNTTLKKKHNIDSLFLLFD